MAEAPRLKPMMSTEILDAAFRLYRSNFVTFLGIFAVIYVPITLVVIAVSGHFYSQAQASILGAADAATRAAAERDLQVIQGGLTIMEALLYALIAVPLATGALTCAVGMRYLNEPASIGKAYRQIFPLFFKYFGTTLLSGLVTGLGFMFCLVPGFLFMTWFFATTSIVCLEGKGGTAAMGRSRDLVRGFGGRIFGFLILTSMLQGVLVGPVSVAAEFLLPLITESFALRFALSTVLQQLLGMIITPFFSAVLVLLYYDLRIRKEAFDLEVLARNLGKAPPPETAPAQP
ncbi:MAG TPA: hypothetical protein VF950_25835 [Planctomycetota bacterium]